MTIRDAKTVSGKIEKGAEKKLTADQVLFFFNWVAGSCQVNLLKTEPGCSEAC